MEDLLEKMKEQDLYDFVANNYWNMSKEQLKEVILSILGVVYDEYAHSNKDWKDFEKKVHDEYKERTEW